MGGDILELALSTTNEAAMVFERFIELILPRDGGLFEGIVYLPGNHDHHLWEIARETQYVHYFQDKKPGSFLSIPWHTTKMFLDKAADQVPSYFLTKLIKRYDHLKNFTITTAYPNFGLFREDTQRCVVFTHGHFIEPLYQLFSTVRSLIFPNRDKPRHIWELEAENFAWIDFFLVDNGAFGKEWAGCRTHL